MKVVHVQLAHERVHAVVLEVGWQDLVDETLPVLDLEEEAIVAPRNRFSVLAQVDDLVELLEEGGDGLFTVFGFGLFFHDLFSFARLLF